jgi:hypothetical protein
MPCISSFNPAQFLGPSSVALWGGGHRVACILETWPCCLFGFFLQSGALGTVCSVWFIRRVFCLKSIEHFDYQHLSVKDFDYQHLSDNENESELVDAAPLLAASDDVTVDQERTDGPIIVHL